MIPQPTKQQVQEAIAFNGEQEKVERLRPTLEDYKSEGVIPYVPEGKYSFPVNGKRVLEMNAEANRAAAWYGDNRADTSRRKAFREARTEKKARKFHRAAIRTMVGFGMQGWQYRCTKGHTFGFLKGKPDAECRKCVRDGCGASAYRERA